MGMLSSCQGCKECMLALCAQPPWSNRQLLLVRDITNGNLRVQGRVMKTDSDIDGQWDWDANLAVALLSGVVKLYQVRQWAQCRLRA
jgi:hypothetical protein